MYSREIDDQVLTLSASGWTYKRTFVLYDLETESLWYHLEGTDGLTCISGQYLGQHLAEFPSTFTRWDEWQASHPETGILQYP